MMKKLLSLILVLVCLLVVSAFGQASSVVKTDLSQAEIDRIVKKFTQNEALFRQALNVYAFNRYATMQTVGMGGQISGTFKRDSYLTFNEAGERFEKILFAPISTVTEISISVEDIDNLGGIDPFAIEPKVANQYNFTFLGKEKIDELNLYVFEVGPKVMPDWKKGLAKFFQGRIWVDDEDLMIVKSKGKAVPEGKQRFATMETTRENVDGKYWFPSFTSSDDELVFDNGQATKMRIRVRYKDYKLGRSDVKIVGEEDVPPEKPTPTPTSTPPPLVRKP
jgi:outer membrane lipoprotein-sorting protein